MVHAHFAWQSFVPWSLYLILCPTVLAAWDSYSFVWAGWWSHVLEDLQRLVWILQICFFKVSLSFSENVAPSSQPENKDFTMPSSAAWVRCYLRASVNCISCSIWMCPTTAWWRCPKSWISVWKLQNHPGLGFGAHVCVWSGSLNLKNSKFRSSVGKNWYL